MGGLTETETNTVVAGGDWGAWGLGDLADVSRRAAELLGSGTDARVITVEPPRDRLRLARVIVVVRDEEAVALLADRVTTRENLPRYCGNPFGGGWVAEVDDMELHVQPELEAWR
jgi:hypothetical protein